MVVKSRGLNDTRISSGRCFRRAIGQTCFPDVRNKLASATLNGVTSTYIYDDDGDRVSETTSGTTTNYLIDTKNPTGYDQPLEETVAGTTTPARTYFLSTG